MFLQYVGESERAVRQVFSRARASSPCVVFFDELDALVPRRDESMVRLFLQLPSPLPTLRAPLLVHLAWYSEPARLRLPSPGAIQSESSARVVNTLLTELDGLDARKSVYVIAATNRPDMIDPAICRPGRLDKLLYVDLPTADERAEIVRTVTRRVPLGVYGDEQSAAAVKAGIEALVRERGDGYSGADLAALAREAGVVALRRTLGTLDALDTEDQIAFERKSISVGLEDFVNAFEKVQPSVSLAQRRRYQALRSKYSGLPVRTRKEDEDERAKQTST